MSKTLMDLVDIALEHNIKYKDVVQVYNKFTLKYFNRNNIPLINLIEDDYSFIENRMYNLTDRYFSIYKAKEKKQ